MDAANEAAPPARDQERDQVGEGETAGVGESMILARWKQLRQLGERFVVLLDVLPERRDPAIVRGLRRVRVDGGDHPAERVRQRIIDAPSLGEMIERLGLVEAAHLDRPFDHLAVTPDRKAAVGRTRDRHHAAIDLRGIALIDLDLGLAGDLALGERRKVEEREFDRALDLEHALAGEKHHRRMGIDALDFRAAMGRRIAEQRKHRLLGSRVGVHLSDLDVRVELSAATRTLYNSKSEVWVAHRNHDIASSCGTDKKARIFAPIREPSGYPAIKTTMGRNASQPPRIAAAHDLTGGQQCTFEARSASWCWRQG
jgi:hypothetical protein